MKINLSIISLLLMGFLFSLLNCKKEPPKVIPVVTTTAPSLIKSDGALTGGNVTSDGGSLVTASGVCWSTNPNPTIEDNKTNEGAGISEFISSITGLTRGTTYYIRAYATNEIGTAYGNLLSFTTLESPLVLTVSMTGRGYTNASFNVSVSADEDSSVIARGICWDTNSGPTIANNKTTEGSGAGTFTSQVTGLDPSTDYYFRAYVTTNDTTIYAIPYNVSYFQVYPRVYTYIVSVTSPTTAIIWGEFDTDWQHPVTTRGVCWSTTPHPTIADNKTEEWTLTIGSNGFKCSILGLTPNTTYYLRAFAGGTGTLYGNEFSFVAEQLNGPTVTDIDGNMYHTVTIGTQTWMAENLKTTRYRNGDSIPEVKGSEWLSLTTGAWCNYNDPNYAKFYDYSALHGKLYNWYAVNDPRNIAPPGWHVPSEAEWRTLFNYLKNNGSQDVAKSLAAKSGWYGTNRALTDLATNNSSGFTALPAGLRVYHWPEIGQGIQSRDEFYGKNSQAKWWSSSGSDVVSILLYLGQDPFIITYDFKIDGFSVRCIKD